eukprot:XP_013974499.1 uncharacterized protein LOC102153939 [Canis lupus familiaris]
MATAVTAAKTARAAANCRNSSFSPLPGGGFTRLRWLPPGPAARDGRAAILEERRPRISATCAPIGGRRSGRRHVTVSMAPARGGGGGGRSAARSARVGRPPKPGFRAGSGLAGVETGSRAAAERLARPPPHAGEGRLRLPGGARPAGTEPWADGAADLARLGDPAADVL